MTAFIETHAKVKSYIFAASKTVNFVQYIGLSYNSPARMFRECILGVGRSSGSPVRSIPAGSGRQRGGRRPRGRRRNPGDRRGRGSSSTGSGNMTEFEFDGVRIRHSSGTNTVHTNLYLPAKFWVIRCRNVKMVIGFNGYLPDEIR